VAKITKSYIPDVDLTIFTVSGETTFDDIWDQTRAFFGGKSSKLALWDFTSGTVAPISNLDDKEIARRVRVIRAGGKRGKGAILAPENIDYGTGRAFQVFSEFKDFPFEIKVFRDMAAAKKWLTSEK
jgi:hypothetical protein